MDRLLAAAAAVANLVDRRLVRLAGFGGMRRAGSAIVGALALVLGLGGMVAGAGTTDQAAPRPISVAEVLDGDARPGEWVALSGHALPTWIETYEDTDSDGTQDPEETASEFAYILAVSGEKRGIVVRTALAPREALRMDAIGTVVEDREYVATDVDVLGTDLGRVTLRPEGYVDTTLPATGAPAGLDPAQPLPPDGTAVRVQGPLAEFIVICAAEPTASGCGSAGIDGWDLVVLDLTGAMGVVVFTDAATDAFPITFSGLLADEPGQMRGLEQLDDGSSIRDAGWDLPDALYLDEGERPVAGTTFVGAGAMLAILGASLLVGRAVGPIRFRPMPVTVAPRSVLAVGEGIPARATGTLLLPGAGAVGAIDAPAALIRLPPMAPTPPDAPPPGAPPRDAAAPGAPAAAPVEAAPAERAAAGDPPPSARVDDGAPVPGTPTVVAASERTAHPVTDAPATDGARDGSPPTDAAGTGPPILLVRRTDGAEGLAVGRGETRTLEAGTVRTVFRERPALRLTTAVGPLVLAFDDPDARDGALAELLEETGVSLGSTP